MFEERIAAMNQRTEEAMAANAVQFDKRTYTVDEIQDILGISRTSAYNLVKKKVFHVPGTPWHHPESAFAPSALQSSNFFA